MKNGYTHIGLVLDASGSMQGIADDIRGSLRAFAKEQLASQEPGETIALDMWQFDSNVEHIVHNAPLDAYDPSGYHCGGCTALYDAVCVAVDELGKQFAALKEEERPEDVLFVIVTDGEENSSRQFRLADVRKRIETQTNVYNWKFLFLASNIDVDAVGQDLGVVDDGARVPLSSENFACEMSARMSVAQADVRAARRARNNNK